MMRLMLTFFFVFLFASEAMAGKKRRYYLPAQPAAPATRSTPAATWERHVRDTHYSQDHSKECDENGCLYTNRSSYRHDTLDQYYVPHGTRTNWPTADIYQTAPLYVRNRCADNATFKIEFMAGSGEWKTYQRTISPGTDLFVGNAAEGTSYKVTRYYSGRWWPTDSYAIGHNKAWARINLDD